jgi:hypothetical protein
MGLTNVKKFSVELENTKEHNVVKLLEEDNEEILNNDDTGEKKKRMLC